MIAFIKRYPLPILTLILLIFFAYFPFEFLSKGKLVTFAVAGGAPADLRKPLEALPDARSLAFVAYLGGLNPAGSPCAEENYRAAFDVLRRSKPPVFALPGEAEWTGCADPKQAWLLWSKYFFRMEERWKTKPAVARMAEQEENFAFTRRKVLFVGVNLVGGEVRSADEWRQRHAEDIVWIHRQFAMSSEHVRAIVVLAPYGARRPAPVYEEVFNALQAAAEVFNGPVLFVHRGEKGREIEKGFLAKNLTRMSFAAPLEKITVSEDPENPFRFVSKSE